MKHRITHRRGKTPTPLYMTVTRLVATAGEAVLGSAVVFLRPGACEN